MSTRMASRNGGLLDRWSRFAVRRRGPVVIAWVVILVGLVAAIQVAGGEFSKELAFPGTDSHTARELLDERFPAQSGDSAQLVFRAEQPVREPVVRARIEAVLAEAAALPSVIAVASPYAPGGGGVSADGHIAFATVQYAQHASAVPKADARQLLTLADGANSGDLTVEAGGFVVQQVEVAPAGSSEAIGLAAAMVILLIAFGSVVAMGLPLVTALIGLGVSIALMALGMNVIEGTPEFATSFVGMIGLGVGIDYALFVVTRYREGLRDGLSVEDAIVQAIGTAGRSVAFAGSAVVIALLGLLTVGIPFVGAIGIAAATVVAVSVLIALTLLPALLAFAGRRIDRLSIPFLHATDRSDTASIWYRLAMAIQRRPLRSFFVSFAVLVVLALPVAAIELGASDAGNGPTSLHSRRAYDLLAEGFGPGFNGPLIVVVDLTGARDQPATLDAMRGALGRWSGVAAVSPALLNPARDAAVITAIPRTAPQDAETRALVYELRETVLPNVTASTGARAHITGRTAAFVDGTDTITARLPVFIGAVIGLSFLLLMAVFRSVLVAAKAAVMNLLSIGAAYGVIVALFQWGWGESLLGVKAGPIESFLPMMLFAILFGLSMDYEVFLISRIRERYLQTGDNAEAVAHGLTATARLITAAALIMVTVFLSFALDPSRIVKEFGVGLATAIFVDATIVRLVLVPATMDLLGGANWWMPDWLGWLLPRLDVEGTHQPQPVPMPGD